MRLVVGLVIVALLAPGIPGAASAQATLGIAEQRVVDIEDIQPLSLSPDGKRLAVWNRAGEEPALCILDAATLTEERCAPIPRGSLAPDSVAWSPDGTHLAATEEALRYGEDGDIWVVDVEAGTATNLTDDGTEDRLGAPPGTPVDVAPAWSPDGTELVFSRTVSNGEVDEDGDDIEATSLFRISATGGEPREVVKVADRPLVVYAGLRWQADGTLVYPVDMYSEDPANGVWTVAVDGGTPHQVVTAEEAGAEQIIIVDVSIRGQALIRNAQVDLFALLDLATGEVTPLTSAIEGSRPAAATFSPDGARLLVVDALADPSGQLVVLDLATGEHSVVGALNERVSFRDYRSGLNWGANNLVFMPTNSGYNGLLIQLTGA